MARDFLITLTIAMCITRRRGQWGPIKTNLSDILYALCRFIWHPFFPLLLILRRNDHSVITFLFLFVEHRRVIAFTATAFLEYDTASSEK